MSALNKLGALGSTLGAHLVQLVEHVGPQAKDRVAKTLADLHVKAYRATGGRYVGQPGATALLLTTTGRKTGQERTTALFYLDQGDRYLLVASYGGDDRHPQWFRNIEADPHVRIQINDTLHRAVARVLPTAERAEVWPALVAHWPGYRDYQARTERELPVVALTVGEG